MAIGTGIAIAGIWIGAGIACFSLSDRSDFLVMVCIATLIIAHWYKPEKTNTP